jgi:predicted house-cleaning NTP pyrophosphatase (Maf/HAM1 superfamily)
MPSGFNVTAETLQADATRIANGASNIEGHLAFLQNAVSSVVNSQSAAALHEKLDRAGRDVKESTTFFSQSTDTAAKSYAAREDEVRSAFTGG